MDIQSEWGDIRRHFARCFQSNFFVAISSVGADGNPSVTPIGSLFLNHGLRGFYFEKYPSKLPDHANFNSNICVLAVDSSRYFWLKSLWTGRFMRHPAIKLYGRLEKLRSAEEHEIRRLRRRMRFTKGMKGNTYLWGDMTVVRDISFYKAEKTNLGKMTTYL